ncbi:hypothetical protein [Anaerococcus sp.]|uniref:hypothetical protein n=1 Tax=Anaerococcus sp. TaxID=1872515 RepID=UPI002903A281|nr:hypothetical protein [Anaerococcus sp.]MDU3212153.1 hypothetical protein [Anaerococcus sp.]
MILKIKFNYACEVQASEEEIVNIKKNMDDENSISEITEHVNEIFLANDGRTEVGMISNFNY